MKKVRAFTLVELLVVVTIISLLVSILTPSLQRAKGLAKEAVCLTRLHGFMNAIYMYAGANRGRIPIGPDDPMSPPMPPLPYNTVASNQLWIGSLKTYNGCGGLIKAEIPTEDFFFCPGDTSGDPKEELEKLFDRGDEDAYGSYLYRQLDQAESPRLDSMGRNDDGLRVKVLILDMNSSMPGLPERSNHGGLKVNIAFIDGHATTHDNTDERFSLRRQDIVNPFARLDEILKEADRLGQ